MVIDSKKRRRDNLRPPMPTEKGGVDLTKVTQEDEDDYWRNRVVQPIEVYSEQIPAETDSSLVEAFRIAAATVQIINNEISAFQLDQEHRVEINIRRNRKGRLRCEVSDVYVHDNVPCGIQDCTVCEQYAPQAVTNNIITNQIPPSKLHRDEPIIILDTPVIRSQTDFLWFDPAINNGVILQSSLDKIRNEEVDDRLYTTLLRLVDAKNVISLSTNHRQTSLRGIIDGQMELGSDRRYFVFCNTVHSFTAVPKRPEDNDGDLDIRAVAMAARWYKDHHGILMSSGDGRGFHEELSRKKKRLLPPVFILTSTEQRKTLLSNVVWKDVPIMDINEFLQIRRATYPHVGEQLNFSAIAPQPSNAAPDIYPAYVSAAEMTRLIARKTAVCGVLRSSSAYKAVVYQRHQGQEVRVYGALNINRCIDGDRVVVKLLDTDDSESMYLKCALNQELQMDGTETDESELLFTRQLLSKKATWTQESLKCLEAMRNQGVLYGRVVAVIKRHSPGYCGSLKLLSDEEESDMNDSQKESKMTLRKFIPVNPRIPNIMITTHNSNALIKQRLVCVIDSWFRNEFLPRGHRVEIIGPVDNLNTECQLILREFNVITRPFPEGALQCLPPEDYEISEQEAERRMDYRLKYCFCDTCRYKRAGQNFLKGENKEFVGTPYIYTLQPHLPFPLENWSSSCFTKKNKNSKTITPGSIDDVIQKRVANPMLEEYDLDIVNQGTICCSIDPPTCVDIDDSLSVRYLKNGNYEIGVHIADVTHYVRSGTALDQEAAERCTTVYLVNQRTDMLPKLLSADLCSLRSGVDRLTFSCVWEVTPDAVIVNTHFHKSIIHNVAALSYRQAQDIIDNTSDQGPLAIRLRLLNNLAQKFKNKRLEAGAVELAAMEVKFTFSMEDSDPVSVEGYEHLETHTLVEEFMLLANRSVAHRIVASFPDYSVLRRHPAPKTEALESLRELLKTKGLDFRFDSNRALAESLNACVLKNDPSFNRYLRAITVKCMNQAVYCCTGTVTDVDHRKHYALACDVYTHFTSPIRRYADIMVHRLLAAAIDWSSLPLDLMQTKKIERQCEKISSKHKLAQFCQRASQEYFIYRLFSRLGEATQHHAIVTGIRSNGVFLMLPTLGVEGLAKISPEDGYAYDPTSASLIKNGGSLHIFDHVITHVKASNEDFRFKVTFTLLRKATEREIQDFKTAESKIALTSGEA